MRVGQTSVVVFLAKVLSSALGFVANIYFARVLGAEVIGIYSVVIALAAWLRLGGRTGITKAMKKRISEGNDRGAYLTAGIASILVTTALLTVAIFLASDHVEAYVAGFEQYSSTSVVWFVVAVLLSYLSFSLVVSTLMGQRLVHVAGLLHPSKLIAQSVIQISLVFLGFQLVGMVVGYAAGIVLVTLAGIAFVTVRPRRPTGEHFRSLYDYAKFSWLGGLKTRAFNDVDILILGALVSQSLVGIYAIAWSLSKFLDLFGQAISQTVFPEISNISAQESKEAAVGLIEDAMVYAGLVVIPGLVGGVLVDDRLLRIYSAEFVQGTEVLWLLLLSILFYSYLQQHLNALNALDRPDLAFRVNVVFMASNAGLNVLLIWHLGWVGAAIASATSSFVGLVLSYVLLSRLVTYELPLGEIGRQVSAALVMGGVVWGLRTVVETTGVVQHNFVVVALLVGAGAGTYTLFLLVVSPEFRTTVDRNLPFGLPYLGDW